MKRILERILILLIIGSPSSILADPAPTIIGGGTSISSSAVRIIKLAFVPGNALGPDRWVNQGIGSGVVVGNGKVLTALHVVDDGYFEMEYWPAKKDRPNGNGSPVTGRAILVTDGFFGGCSPPRESEAIRLYPNDPNVISVSDINTPPYSTGSDSDKFSYAIKAATTITVQNSVEGRIIRDGVTVLDLKNNLLGSPAQVARYLPNPDLLGIRPTGFSPNRGDLLPPELGNNNKGCSALEGDVSPRRWGIFDNQYQSSTIKWQADISTSNPEVAVWPGDSGGPVFIAKDFEKVLGIIHFLEWRSSGIPPRITSITSSALNLCLLHNRRFLREYGVSVPNEVCDPNAIVELFKSYLTPIGELVYPVSHTSTIMEPQYPFQVKIEAGFVMQDAYKTVHTGDCSSYNGSPCSVYDISRRYDPWHPVDPTVDVILRAEPVSGYDCKNRPLPPPLDYYWTTDPAFADLGKSCPCAPKFGSECKIPAKDFGDTASNQYIQNLKNKLCRVYAIMPPETPLAPGGTGCEQD